MRFGLLYHHQVPRPWTQDSEERVIRESLEQIELADRLGFDYAWATEHHFLDEYSHSSAPEVFLAAAAAKTDKIRLAHGIVSLPPAVNHPVRVAERLATLDLISGGRVEFGSGQGSTQHELGAFHIDRATKREQWREAIDVVVRLLTEVPFTGHDGTHVSVPPRNLLPKPKQNPHPPLWMACSNPASVEDAGRNGMGALSFAFIGVDEARERVEAYYRAIESDDCVPVGRAVNANFAVVLPFMLAADEATALERGLDGVHFYASAFSHFYLKGRHRPGVTDLSAQFAAERAQGKTVADQNVSGDDLTQAGSLSDFEQALRRGIGDPQKIRDLIRAHEEAGVDQIIFQVQLGNTRHEHIMEALELFAREVMPEFAERRPGRDLAKKQRLAVPVKAALDRVPARTADVCDYVIATDLETFAPPAG
ncbi:MULTISPECIES: LLM class flavin-dependent oxidoreductase [Streptomyces]|uniref:LLM class flavin-dependent oxidoreductase n=1 Tax=Streptomyces lienomycini TaxID=284035 RepID=A0ABV9X970_9ACTN|nr:LLM class flavin-dependent oxidoreductase [Streptomyces sp. NBC_00334]